MSERQVVEKLPRFTSELVICTGPVVSVESVTYLDEDGVEATFTDFRLYDSDKLVPQVGFSWPQSLSRSDVQINATVGYADNAVPKKIIQALRLLVSHQYEHREAVVVGTIASELPMGVKSLIHSVRGERV